MSRFAQDSTSIPSFRGAVDTYLADLRLWTPSPICEKSSSCRCMRTQRKAEEVWPSRGCYELLLPNVDQVKANFAGVKRAIMAARCKDIWRSEA